MRLRGVCKTLEIDVVLGRLGMRLDKALDHALKALWIVEDQLRASICNLECHGLARGHRATDLDLRVVEDLN